MSRGDFGSSRTGGNLSSGEEHIVYSLLFVLVVNQLKKA